jgi:prepilin-type N-terminal cleavage/methylation domain-containing protein
MKHQSSGFSLIELMVVIAIVAILAAISLPAYKSYIIRTKLTSVITTLEFLGQQSHEYASKHGYYPNAEELGVGSGAIADNSLVSQAAGFLTISGDSCGASQYITFYIDVANVFPDTSYDTVLLQYFLYNVDGFVRYYKAYALGNMGSNTSDPNIYLPQGWINLNTGSSWDLSAGVTENGDLENLKECQ